MSTAQDAAPGTAGSADAFETHRPHLRALAYRMLGSMTDADDVLQDAWLRWTAADRSDVRSPAAFLTRTVTNLCLTALTSARARREVYVGPWLPEPVVTGSLPGGPRALAGTAPLGPLDDVAQRESVSFALLALLERLTPAERAAYVLREAFAYSHHEVAEVLGTSDANARQLHSRARRRLDAQPAQEAVPPRSGRPGDPAVDPARWRTLVESFLAAAADGDVARLESLLAADVVSRADGGGVVRAAARPVVGRGAVARYLVGVLARWGSDVVPVLVEANGGPAMVAVQGGRVTAVCFLEFDAAGTLRSLDIALHPDKIAFAAAQLSHLDGLSGREE